MQVASGKIALIDVSHKVIFVLDLKRRGSEATDASSCCKNHVAWRDMVGHHWFYTVYAMPWMQTWRKKKMAFS